MFLFYEIYAIFIKLQKTISMILKILNLVFLIAMVYVNYLANSLPINSQTTGEISNAYSNLFTPAGITFSI